MVAIADEKALFLLEFVDGRGVEREVAQLSRVRKAQIESGTNNILHSIDKELADYFAGRVSMFKTPLEYMGTPFQKQVWDELRRIPYGTTQSYADVAKAIHKPTAFRAVANANGRNQIAVVIPCHRVINSNGELGGYGGRVDRKQWLLDHEKIGR
jgi:AraC family transcriptional regulator of adaptative response/methylated-DNA-[protein]-cysteine methyltransferase